MITFDRLVNDLLVLLHASLGMLKTGHLSDCGQEVGVDAARFDELLEITERLEETWLGTEEAGPTERLIVEWMEDRGWTYETAGKSAGSVLGGRVDSSSPS